MTGGDIGDIKDTVHAIQSDLRVYREDQLRQDSRLAKIEGRQDGVDKLMSEAHQRLDEKIDGVQLEVREIGRAVGAVGTTLKEHTEREDADRRNMIRQLWVVLIGVGVGVVGFIAQLVITHMGKLG